MSQITVYSQPDCPPCEITKKFLTEYGFPFEVKNIKTDHKAKKELIQKYNSYTTPTIIIEDTVITGFDLVKLKDVLKIEE